MASKSINDRILAYGSRTTAPPNGRAAEGPSFKVCSLQILAFLLEGDQSKTYCKRCAKRMSSDGGVVDSKSSPPLSQISSLSTQIPSEDLITPAFIYMSQNSHSFLDLNLPKIELSLLKGCCIES